LKIDQLIYLMGAQESLISPIGPSDIEFPLKSYPIVCDTSILGIFESLNPILHEFLHVQLPPDEVILKSMIFYGIPLEYIHRILFFFPELETLQVDYQRNPWPEASNGICLNNYYA
jgi:hypothetical protein